MPGSFRSSASATAMTTSTTVVVTKPTGVAAGDLLIAVAYFDPANSMSPPAGWTQIESVSGSARAGKVWVKRAGGSEPSSYTFTTGASHGNGVAVGIVAYQDVGDVEDSSITEAASGTSASAPAVTAAGGDRFVLFFGLIQSNGSNLDPGAGWTSRLAVSEAGGPANTQDGLTVYEKAVGAGSSGSVGATAGSAYGGHVAGLVVFPDTPAELTACDADDFDRANNTTSMGATDQGRLWVPLNVSGTFDVGINSNHAYCSDDAPGGKVVVDLHNSEHDVKVKPFGFVAGTHFAPAVLFRHNPSGHEHYAILAFTGSGANNHPALFKFDSSNNGTFVKAWAGVTWASGDELRARAHGDLVDFYLAGTLVEAGVALDAAYADYTRAGIRFEQISGTSQYYDDWEACPVADRRFLVGAVAMG